MYLMEVQPFMNQPLRPTKGAQIELLKITTSPKEMVGQYDKVSTWGFQLAGSFLHSAVEGWKVL